MLSGQIFRIEQNLTAQITVFGLASKWDFFPGRALVNPSPAGLMHPGPAQSEASAVLQRSVDRTVLSAPAWSLLELKPVLGELWNIVPGRVLTKLYQEASAVCRENLGCPLSSPTLHMEKIFKRQIIWGTSLAQCQWECAFKELKERMVEASDPNAPQGWLW